MKKLQISHIKVSVAHKEVVKDVSLEILPGELHVIMGPNGSGKSSLAHALAGHPSYQSDAQILKLNGHDILEQSPDERARLGLFLAFQYPVEIAGVSVRQFLRQAHLARFEDEPKKQFEKVLAFREHLKKVAKDLGVSESFLTRGLNEGFSGGEKKRLEILQMAVLEPKYAILDESDSGLDIDAVKQVAKGIEYVRNKFQTGMIVITHYQRILQFLTVNKVHVMIEGKIVQSGGKEMIKKIEDDGYKTWMNK